MNTILPILGAAIALLAILSAAVMLRRRRNRRYETEEVVYEQAEAPAAELVPESFAPAAVAAPVVTAPTPVHDPIFDTAPASTAVAPLPEGFDLSRFGRHTQAAYRGPTPDNPSLSLKHRLRKASALDQRERLNRTEPVAESAAVKAAAARAAVAPAGGDFMLGQDRTKATVRRAYSE